MGHPMAYTIWSRGRLIGRSELSYRQAFPKLRVGDFEPSEVGEKLMSVIVGQAPALTALYEVAARLEREERKKVRGNRDDWADAVKHTTEYADAASLHDEIESLALELRDASGAVVRTESIWFQDTYRLRAIAGAERACPDTDLGDDPEPWEPEPPRYQIYVALVGHDEWMTRAARSLPQ